MSSQGMEMKPEQWALYNSACYLGGRGITLGSPIVPGKSKSEDSWSVVVDPTPSEASAIQAEGFGMFRDGEFDHVYIGPRLGIVPNWKPLLAEGWRKLKLNGHLVVFLRLNFSDQGQVEFTAREVTETLGGVGKWKEKFSGEFEGWGLWILKKIDGRRGIVPADPPPPKRACVVRYGAIGDAVIITPMIRQLHEEGYHVTVNVSRYCKEVFSYNPYVDNLLIHEREMIPNGELGAYWKFWEPQYDKYIQLSESLEGELLQVESRKSFYTSKAWRVKQGNKNYYTHAFVRAGLTPPERPRGELFFSNSEEREMKKFFAGLEGKFVILWALNGSSHHKIYPLMEPVMQRWWETHKDTVLITVGDHVARLLEIDDHPLSIPKADKWSIREAMLATKYASLVVGPETAITNAAGCYPTPKIVLLSHSSQEALTKHFENDFSLTPSPELAPCHPCFQLHFSKESCPLVTIQDTTTNTPLAEVPICCAAIGPQRLLDRIEEVYTLWKEKKGCPMPTTLPGLVRPSEQQ